ncbi:MAG: restriction endonuclease subunit S [Bacteroidales bacterium]|nr:restriction endonuclease subunit S [Bacteroidales bacterium]
MKEDKLSLQKRIEVKKLGEVSNINYGYTEKASFERIGPKFLRITDIQENGVNWDTVPFCKISDEDLAKYKLRDGDIVFARTGATTGKSFLVTCPPNAVFASYLIKVHISNDVLSPDYLYLFFQTKRYWDVINSGISGSAQGGFNATKLSDLEIPIPTLPEQKRIVSILDQTFTAISKAKSNAEQNLKNAKELFESYLQGVFASTGSANERLGWEEKELIKLTTKIGSGATPRGGNENYKSEGISLVRSMNVHDFEFREKNLAFIDDQQAKDLNNVTVQENDVLLNITGASVARCCIIPKKYLPARVNQHVSIIRAQKEIIDPAFLNLVLTSKYYKDQLLLTGEQGATRQAITKAQLENFKISYPKSINDQQVIIKKVSRLSSEIKKLEEIYKKKTEDLEELKKSILQKAFSGEL